ncbi:hypothetical protein BH24BAC1_BH24BAC1_36080 [soil metagenome]
MLPPFNYKREGKSALVIGGSFAGLLAARILSDHFDQVTILERDLVQDGPESRKGQPHTRHAHGLLVQGLNLITGYFPDLIEGLIKGGPPLQDMAQNMRWYCYGGYRTRFSFGLKGIITSRPFLEWHIRQRVLALPNVTIRDGAAVENVLASEDQKQIKGVQISSMRPEGGPQTLLADLVVDASGRGSRSPRWLEALDKQNRGYSVADRGGGRLPVSRDEGQEIPGHRFDKRLHRPVPPGHPPQSGSRGRLPQSHEPDGAPLQPDAAEDFVAGLPARLAPHAG